MGEKDWIIISTLFEEKNITKTAQRLYISQPALTYRLQQIEKMFGIKIITRGKKGVEFTAQGEYLVQYSKMMLSQLQKLKDTLASMDNRVKGTLRLGVSTNFAHYQLPNLLKEFTDLFPDVEINLKTGWTSEVLQLAYKEEVHVAIVRGDINWQEQKQLLHREPICIVSKKPIKLEKLPSMPRINYQTDFHLKTVIDGWWQQTYASLPPLVRMEVDKIETCKEMVKKGLGYAIIPSICLKESDGLYSWNLTTPSGEPILRNTWLICKNAVLELSMVTAFLEFTKNYS